MTIYEVGTDKLRRVEETSFGTAGLGERADLQRLLQDQVTEVSPDTLVIAEEFSDWANSRRRIDLLGIDKEANLVVIELKRTDDGGHMELQAVRYAAMVSTLMSQRAVEIFNEYLRARGRDEDAEQQLLEFLEWDEFDEDKFAQEVRLVLVSADFSKELTSAVLWLNDKDLDIRCVRIKPVLSKNTNELKTGAPGRFDRHRSVASPRSGACRRRCRRFGFSVRAGKNTVQQRDATLPGGDLDPGPGRTWTRTC